MECGHEIRGETMVVGVSGRVDEASWAQFQAGLSAAVAAAGDAGLARLVIDLSALDYMSSRGLRVLTIGKREGDEAGIAVSLAAPNAVMREILEISRYDKLFVIADDVEAALASE